MSVVYLLCFGMIERMKWKIATAAIHLPCNANFLLWTSKGSKLQRNACTSAFCSTSFHRLYKFQPCIELTNPIHPAAQPITAHLAEIPPT